MDQEDLRQKKGEKGSNAKLMNLKDYIDEEFKLNFPETLTEFANQMIVD